MSVGEQAAPADGGGAIVVKDGSDGPDRVSWVGWDAEVEIEGLVSFVQEVAQE
jgi:hypothetical protein